MLLRTVVVMLAGILIDVADAAADGGFFYPLEASVQEPSQVAVVKHKDGEEELVLLVKYASGNGARAFPDDFAWIVPLPSKPEVAEGEEDLFDDLWLLSRPVRREPSSCGCMGESSVGGVEVIEKGTIGFLGYQVLEAEATDALTNYLSTHGYGWAEQEEEILREYIEKGWRFFFAAQVDAASAPDPRDTTGSILPVRLSFLSAVPVYPLRISAATGGYTDLVLYVLTEHRMTFPGAELRFAQNFDRAKFDELGKQYPTLAAFMDGPLFITKLARSFEPAEMEDIELVQAPDDSQYRELAGSRGAGNSGMLAFSVAILPSLRRRKK